MNMLVWIVFWWTASVASILLTESLIGASVLMLIVRSIIRGFRVSRIMNSGNRRKQSITALLCLGGAWIMTVSYQHSYIHQQQDTLFTTISGGRLVYQGPLTITQQGLNGRYQAILPDGSEWFVRSTDSYRAGDRLFVTANARRGLTGETLTVGWKSWNLGSGLLIGSGYEFNYPYRLMMKGIQGDLYLSNALILHRQSQPDYLTITRNTLQDLITATLGTGQTAALTQGMLIGDRSGFTKPEYQMFIDSGLVHLIAVSGGNIVMLVTFLLFVLRWIPYYLRISIILIMVILYAMLCGLDSSVVRAAIMGGLSLLALLVGRGIDVWRALQLAWLSMLIINPYYLVYDVGFLLSFCAVIGLVVLTPQMTLSEPDINKKKLTRYGRTISTLSYGCRQLWNRYLVPSCAATLGVLPILLFFMGSINVVGIIANLLVVPLVPLVMVIGIGVSIISPLIEITPLIWLQHGMVAYIFQIGYLTMQYGIYITVHVGWVKIIMLIGGLAWLGWEVYRHGSDSDPSIEDSNNLHKNIQKML